MSPLNCKAIIMIVTLKEELESKGSNNSEQSKEYVALEVSYHIPLLSTRYFDQRDLADEPS